MRKLGLAVAVLLLLGSLCFAEYVPCKVKLGLLDRLVVMGLLPQESNFATLKIVTDLQLQLGPTEEEFKKAGLSAAPNGGVIAKDWNAVEEKEFTFGEIAEGIIVDALKKMDKEKKLKREFMSVYEKFIKE